MKYITLILALALVACSHSANKTAPEDAASTTVAAPAGPPWEVLEEDEKALYTESLSCPEVTNVVSEILEAPMAEIPEGMGFTNPQPIEGHPGFATMYLQASPTITAGVTYKEVNGNKTVIHVMVHVIDEAGSIKSVSFIDFYVIRKLTDLSKEETSNLDEDGFFDILSVATGEYFCLSPI